MHQPQPELDTKVRLAIMSRFLDGQRPSVASVAETLGADQGSVEAAFDRLGAGRAIVLVPGTRDILMASPFAGAPTDFQVRVGDSTYHANCIWDALGIPAMLAGAGRPSDAVVETPCADCDARLEVSVRGGRVRADPADVVAHFAVPAANWWADIVFT